MAKEKGSRGRKAGAAPAMPDSQAKALEAVKFEKIIETGRERKKNEALATQIFGKDRRKSAPVGPGKAGGLGGSLASRVGVQKRIPSGRASLPGTEGKAAVDPSSLAARISRPGQKHGAAPATVAPANAPTGPRRPRGLNVPTGPRATRAATKRTALLQVALSRADSSTVQVSTLPPGNNQRSRLQQKQDQTSSLTIKDTATDGTPPVLSIKGLAGPYSVLAQNFAPGTTAADIEAAITPIGGEMMSCKILKTAPFLLAEMIFMSKEGAERVISQFNGKNADGYQLSVYPNPSGYTPVKTTYGSAGAPVQIVDGTRGFQHASEVAASTYTSQGNGRLYSDEIVTKGRGFGGDWTAR